MSAWIIRAGAHGEREQRNLADGLAGGGFHEVGDLTAATTKDQVRTVVDQAFPGAPAARQANYAGQLWALRDTIQPGDLIVMPLKSTKSKIALGICTHGYTYQADQADPDARHVIGVDWKTTDVPRAAIKADLLNTINGAMTVFQASNNNAEARLRTVLATGTDPGNNTGPAPAPKTSSPASTSTNEGAGEVLDSVLDPTPAPTVAAIRDRVRTHLIENFKGHDLTDLIAAILRCHGYVCDVSPPGPDGGVDILCGRGLLGLESPTLIVEVKSQESPVNVDVVRSLNSAVSDNGSDHGLLVAWGGLNGPARGEVAKKRLRLRVWEADDILDNLFDVYEQLPDTMRARIPLTRAWVLDEETD